MCLNILKSPKSIHVLVKFLPLFHCFAQKLTLYMYKDLMPPPKNEYYSDHSELWQFFVTWCRLIRLFEKFDPKVLFI